MSFMLRLRELAIKVLRLQREQAQHARRLEETDRRLDLAEAELRALRAEAGLGRLDVRRGKHA